MTVNVQWRFDVFDQTISLPQSAVDRIESAWKALSDFLRAELDLPRGAIFLQGSYANGTAIRPLGGEYDVDVVAVMAAPDQTAEDALEQLRQLLASHGRYRDRIVVKDPCIRLEYADDPIGGFHVDVVPCRPTGRLSPPLEAPRRKKGWHGTAPAEYTDWCKAQGPFFTRTVKALKRWRDEHQPADVAVKSIILQVLVAQHMPAIADDALRLARTIESMHAALDPLSEPPVVSNPVLASENLAASWTAEAFRDFVAELDEARRNAHVAVTTPDQVEAVNAWREVLGSDFPGVAARMVGVHLGDDSHARRFAHQGWHEQLDPSYRVGVTARCRRGGRARRLVHLPHDGPLVFHGTKLCFTAHMPGRSDAEVWWQVANTGQAARTAKGLRGTFFAARRLNQTPSPDPRETWEDSSYTGAHWIRAVLVKNGVVVAVSEKFVVNVYNRSQRPGR